MSDGCFLDASVRARPAAFHRHDLLAGCSRGRALRLLLVALVGLTMGVRAHPRPGRGGLAVLGPAVDRRVHAGGPMSQAATALSWANRFAGTSRDRRAQSSIKSGVAARCALVVFAAYQPPGDAGVLRSGRLVRAVGRLVDGSRRIGSGRHRGDRPSRCLLAEPIRRPHRARISTPGAGVLLMSLEDETPGAS